MNPARVKMPMQLHKAALLHMGVNLRGGQIGVTQHILNHT